MLFEDLEFLYVCFPDFSVLTLRLEAAVHLHESNFKIYRRCIINCTGTNKHYNDHF